MQDLFDSQISVLKLLLFLFQLETIKRWLNGTTSRPYGSVVHSTEMALVFIYIMLFVFSLILLVFLMGSGDHPDPCIKPGTCASTAGNSSLPLTPPYLFASLSGVVLILMAGQPTASRATGNRAVQ